jgi:hypothetical protein
VASSLVMEVVITINSDQLARHGAELLDDKNFHLIEHTAMTGDTRRGHPFPIMELAVNS